MTRSCPGLEGHSTELVDAELTTVDPFFTVEELVARWFIETTANTDKTNRDNVRELISSGAIPGRKIGRRWYVHLSTVETYETGRDDPAVMRHFGSRRST